MLTLILKTYFDFMGFVDFSVGLILYVISVYTTYDNRSRVYIYEREGKFDTPPKIDNISIL